MDFALFLIFAFLLSALCFWITFWFELLILKLFVKNLHARYGCVALFNVVAVMTGLARGGPNLLLLLLVGGPVLGIMYWRDRSLTSAGRSSSLR